MHKTKLILTAAVAAALATPAAAPAAKPRLDKGFGSHHGYWVRTDGPWMKPTAIGAAARGTALVFTDDSRFVRIGADGKADRGWGTNGVADLGPLAYSSSAARWNGRYLLFAGQTGDDRGAAARVVDARGRTLPVTDAVQAMLRANPESAGFYYPDRLVPGPDGRLWSLRVFNSFTSDDEQPSLAVLDAAGAPLRSDRIDLVGLPGTVRWAPVASGDGLIVALSDPVTGQETLCRLRADGWVDYNFVPLKLPRGVDAQQMLPWHGGVVVAAADGRVLWVSDAGRVVHTGRLPAGYRVAFDTAGRLVGVSGAGQKTLGVRRLRRNGTTDTAFGAIRLRADGRRLQGLGVVAASGGRLLVVGRSVVANAVFDREDFARPHATVVWRIATR